MSALETKKKVLAWVLALSGSAALVVIYLAIAVWTPTFNIQFYKYEYNESGTYERLDMKEDDLLAVTRHMLRYLNGREKELNVKTYVAEKERLFFSDIEVSHMKDVKGLFTALKVAAGTSLFVFIAALGLFLSPILRPAAAFFVKTATRFCEVVMGLLTLITVIAVFNFNGAFEAFHKIFFNNTDWLLDPRVDLLINIMPEQFFENAAVVCGVIWGALSIATMLAGLGLYGKLTGKKADGEIENAAGDN